MKLFHERLDAVKDSLVTEPPREPNPGLFVVEVRAAIVRPAHVEQVGLQKHSTVLVEVRSGP